MILNGVGLVQRPPALLPVDPRVGEYFSNYRSVTTGILPSSILRLAPIITRSRTVVSHVVCEVVSGSGDGTWYLVAYSSINGLPDGAPLLFSVQGNPASNTAQTLALPSPVVLPVGVVWVGSLWVGTSSPTFRNVVVANADVFSGANASTSNGSTGFVQCAASSPPAICPTTEPNSGSPNVVKLLRSA